MLFIDYKDITDMDFRITCPWIGESDKKLQKIHKTEFHTGVQIPANNVYSYSQGVVIGIGKQSDAYFVTVQFDAGNLFRYCHMKSVNVSINEIVQAGDLIGSAKRWMRFEWATTAESSKFAVWFGDVTYFKQNPERLFSGEVVLRANDWSKVTENEYGYNDGYALTPAMSDEFEVNNRDYDGGE